MAEQTQLSRLMRDRANEMGDCAASSRLIESAHTLDWATDYFFRDGSEASSPSLSELAMLCDAENRAIDTAKASHIRIPADVRQNHTNLERNLTLAWSEYVRQKVVSAKAA